MIKSSTRTLFLASAMGLTSVLSLVSCSKEDSQLAPEVQTLKSVQGNGENFKIESDENLPATDNGSVCKGCAPGSWGVADGGISNTSLLFGNPATPWVKLLLHPRGPAKFVTVKGTGGAYSTITNLIPGQKYKIKFSVSTSSAKLGFGNQSPYSPKVKILVPAQDPEIIGAESKTIDLSTKQGVWVEETMTFTAKAEQHDFIFECTGASSYANISVPKDAITILE